MGGALVYVLPISVIVLLLGSALNPSLSLTMAIIMLGVQIGWWPGTWLRFAPSDIFLFFCLLGMFLNKKVRSEVFEKTPARYWFLAFLGLYIIGNFITIVNVGRLLQYHLINRNIGLLVLFAYYYCAVTLIDDREKLERILKLYVYAGFLLNSVALPGYFAYRFVGIGGIFVYEGVRFVGFLQDPSAWGCFLLSLFFLQVILLLHKSPLFSLRFSILNLLLLSIGIVLTFSRSTYLAFFITLLLFFFLQRRSLLFVPFLAISALIIFFIFQHLGPSFTKQASDVTFFKESIYARTTAIRLGLEWFLRHPILGGGIGSFYKSSAYEYLPEAENLPSYGFDFLHTTYLWFLAEGGLVGIFILLGLFFNFLRGAWQASRTLSPPQNVIALAVFFALFAYYAMGLGVDIFQRRDMWVFFAFSDLLRYLPKPEAGSQEPGVRSQKPGVGDRENEESAAAGNGG
jgi:O-antigen ligase